MNAWVWWRLLLIEDWRGQSLYNLRLLLLLLRVFLGNSRLSLELRYIHKLVIIPIPILECNLLLFYQHNWLYLSTLKGHFSCFNLLLVIILIRIEDLVWSYMEIRIIMLYICVALMVPIFSLFGDIGRYVLNLINFEDSSLWKMGLHCMRLEKYSWINLFLRSHINQLAFEISKRDSLRF